ncbi:MAG: RHS repeat-associated core domain-containing protein, partial [Pyrinomonadaceae bacterium]
MNESYTLDDVGNRTASHQGSSYSYQSFNRLITANSSSFGYDANGNLTSKTDASGTWTYRWDYENRLKQASKSGGVTVSYAYDALGRRIQRTSTTRGTTKFIFDGADVVRDLDGNGATIADYLKGPGIDNKVRQTISGTRSYFLVDHLGATRALADTNGNLISSLGYDSFGNIATGSASTRYTYTGRELDSEVGLMYYRARSYDPQQGRFISEDPIGLFGGINLFTYVQNNPIRFFDPSGLCPQKSSTNQTQPCDRSRAATQRAAQSVARRIPGARVGTQDGWLIINFSGSYNQTIDQLQRSGHYSGILAFNPIDHAGGYEFRTYGSTGFHFKVVYP